MNKISLSIYGVSFLIIHDVSDKQLLTKLKSDFSFFLTQDVQEDMGSDGFHISIYSTIPPLSEYEGAMSSRQSINAISYQCGDKTYHDYYGRALVIDDSKKRRIQIYSLHDDCLHEITYLLILSKSGKKLDLMGLHKIHACAFAHNESAFVFMMPMKGGKTSLFLDLLQRDPELEILSDDTPLITWNGYVHPFPLRIGLEGDAPLPMQGDHSLMYSINRSLYGKKLLFPIEFFPNRISKSKKKVVLVNGIRWNSPSCKMEKVSCWRNLLPLVKNLLVGIGLPMILEYFLEANWKDWFKRARIFLNRFRAVSALMIRARHYQLCLGHSRETNASVVYDFIRRHEPGLFDDQVY